MGKYDAVVKKLPELPAQLREGGLAYQIKVDQAKEQIPVDERKSSDLAARYAELRTRKAQLDKVMYDLNVEVKAVEQLLAQVYEGEGITSLKVKGAGSVRTESEPYANVSDRAAYNSWCMDSGFAPQMTLPWQTTNQTVKDRLLDSMEAPPGVDVYFRTKVVFTPDK